MSDAIDVVAIVGSLRRESYTRRLVEALTGLAAPSLRIEIVPIGALPLYNPDEEPAAPAPWVQFRDRVRRAHAVLWATPEYNRSVPGCLKNALDVGSRPYGQGVWSGKPCAVISASPGAMGAFGANHHLRQCLVFLNMPTLQQPEVYLSGSDKLFDAAGAFVNPSTREFCAKFLTAFEAWIRRNRLSTG
ncbi:MAG TPA: NAD(P)H-dependent oxidoreductase [Steroidobacteraceae bacterium]|nr:NAD(P)H-dependent oxidoreductase [Steroidobacteraceae bacterium]